MHDQGQATGMKEEDDKKNRKVECYGFFLMTLSCERVIKNYLVAGIFFPFNIESESKK